jgi:ADP-ribose pyrophosphatase YjhB (NUDIX family)
LAISNLRQSAGAVFFAKSTLRFLFLLRDDTSFKNTWAFVGGKIDNDEKIVDGLYREIGEEISYVPDIEKLIPIDQFTNTKKKFEYTLLLQLLKKSLYQP